MGQLSKDIGFAYRSLLRHPLQPLLAAATLALAVAATALVFGLLRPVLLDALPHSDGERLHVLAPARWMHAAALDELAGESSALEAVATYYPQTLTVAGGSEPLQVAGAQASPDLAGMIGLVMREGRWFEANESAQAAVLDEALAERLFGAQVSALGRSLRIEGREHQVIGVLRSNSRRALPELEAAEVWLPFDLAAVHADRVDWRIPLMRLREGIDLSAAQAHLDAALQRYSASGVELPRAHYHWVGLREALFGAQQRPLLLLQLSVGLLLALACLNVSNLQLARVMARRAEFALRRSLGAGSAQLARLVLVEAWVLGALAAAFALLLMLVAQPLLTPLLPADYLAASAPAWDLASAMICALLALLAGLLSGALPVLFALRAAAQACLQAPGRGVLGAGRGQRAAGLLLVGQVAATLVLLGGAGLLVRSYQALAEEPPGFRSADVQVLSLRLPDGQAESMAQLDARWQGLRIESVPGVQAVAQSNRLPLARGATTRAFQIEGEDEPRTAQHGVVGTDYLRVLDIPLLRGRFFDAGDLRGGEPVTVIDAALWRQLWPDADPIGRRMRLLAGGETHWLSVIGVVGDIRGSGLAETPLPGFYIPQAQRPDTPTERLLARDTEFLLRTVPGAPVSSEVLRNALWNLEPDLPVPPSRVLDAVLAESIGAQRFRAGASTVFGLFALLIALAGVYALTAQRVTARLPEFGLRKALGASGPRLFREVLRWAMGMAAAGTALGLLGLLALRPLLGGFLHAVSPWDPASLLGAGLLLVLAVLLAATGPARRAQRVDPLQSLRAE
jgi:predicted permease